MKKALLKDCFKEIVKGFKRFISILLIVLLGVGFFAGIKATSPDMKLTLDTYFDDLNVMDIQVISTLGLTDEDITELEKLDEIENAEGTYQTDAIVTAGDEQFVVKLESLASASQNEDITENAQEENQNTSNEEITVVTQKENNEENQTQAQDNETSTLINNLQVTNGRSPENQNECVVEEGFLLGTDYKIGDTIKIDVDNITDDDGNDIALLKNNELQIVGTVKSPMYISSDRGTTKLGSGVINYYLYVHPDNINANIYTNIYLTVQGAKDLKTYNDDYEDLIEEAEDEIEKIADARKEARYNALYDKAYQKLQDAKNEFETQKSDGEKQLQDAENEINSAKNQLEQGRNEIAANRANANNEFNEAGKQLLDAKNTLEQNENDFNAKKQEAEKQISDYETSLNELKQIQTQYNNLQNTLSTSKSQLEILEKQLEELENQANQGQNNVNNSVQNQIANEVEENTSNEEQIETLKNQIEELNSSISRIEAGLLVIDKQLEAQGITDINQTVSSIETAIQTAKTELENGQNQIDSAKAELQNREEQLNSTKSSTYAELDSAERRLDESEKQIEEAEVELAKSREEFNSKIADAEKELDDAEEEVNSIERPTWYILDRQQNAGYVSYMQDTDRVANLAQVFPIVFFIVAALISLTSMTRMVEEQRVQIGTLKALGYNKLQIASKYIIYATLATVIGGAIGLVIGFSLLPKVIADIYAMVYDVPSVILAFNMTYATAGMAAAMLCTIGATIISCYKTLKQKLATLMRPKAPKAGKRVLLERINFIWKRLNFTKKVTVRNIFRYKKRFMMTIIGVGGCTALIIAGFGLRDAISSMIPSQYGKIDLYNISVTLKDEYKNEELENIDNILKDYEYTENVLNANVQSVTIDKDDNTQSIQLIVPQNVEELSNFIVLESRTNNDEKYALDDTGVIITEKLSKLLDIKVGDEIKIVNSDDKECTVKVNAITENYIYHYIYMTPNLYNQLYDTRIGYNVVYVNTTDMTEEQEDGLGEQILSNGDYISGVTFMSNTENIFAEVMNNMDLVVWILIISAGLLAFVVLYNLLNANITERIRELATIKVLGFYDKEVYDYISRETIILTAIGMLVGIGGGYFLTLYIIKTCEIDMLMFNPQITVWSYLFGILITAVFAIIVNIITYFSLKKIDMIESLKSVE